MKLSVCQRLLFIILTGMFIIPECFSESGVYVGGHFRRERPNTIERLKSSGFTYAILFNVNVEEDGTLTSDGEIVCKNGEYVFHQTQPYYAEDVASLKQGNTNITRVEVCIGGWNNNSWFRIKSLIELEGAEKNSILYRNFQALKTAIPSIDAINNDDEHAYDVNSATAFHIMMYDIGFHSTMAPYRRKDYWEALVRNVNEQRPGAVYRIYIQCYDGGAGNNPRDWHLDGLPLHAGRLNYQDFNESINVMSSWKTNQGVSGGFFWVYNDETWDLIRYATAVNRIFHAEENTVATFYGAVNFGGYAMSLPVGSYTKMQLMYYGIPDNSIASLKVSSGYKVTVYVNDNFLGTQKEYTLDSGNLGTLINGRVSSLKIEAASTSLTRLLSTVKCFYDANLKAIKIESEAEDTFEVFDSSGRIKAHGALHPGMNLVYMQGAEKGICFIKTRVQASVSKISFP